MLIKVKRKEILHNNMKTVKLDMPGEAETGNAGGQPVRNNPANVNNRGLVNAKLRFIIIHIIIPKKTQPHYLFLLLSASLLCQKIDKTLFYNNRRNTNELK
jgi:hypothetical protein